MVYVLSELSIQPQMAAAAGTYNTVDVLISYIINTVQKTGSTNKKFFITFSFSPRNL